MKKSSKIVAMLLALVMVLAMCGCGGNAAKKLVGTWGLEYDLEELMTESLGSDFEGFSSPLVMNLQIDLNEDGTYKLYVEEDSFKENFNDWLEAFISYSVDMMYDMFAEQGLEKEDADAAVLDAYGYSIEEYMRQMVGEELDADDLLDEMESNGTYKTDGDKLYMAEDDEEFDEDDYEIFAIDGSKLTISLPEDAEDDDAEIIPGLEYPLVFEKVK